MGKYNNLDVIMQSDFIEYFTVPYAVNARMNHSVTSPSLSYVLELETKRLRTESRHGPTRLWRPAHIAQPISIRD